MPTVADIDHVLAELRDGTEALGEALVELELDGDRRLLDSAVLTGETAARWAPASAALLAAWQTRTELAEVAERAGELRGARGRLRPDRLAELEALLDGRVTRLRETRQAVAAAATIVREAGAAWQAFTPRLAAIEGPDAERLAAALATDPLSVDPAQVDALERELAELAQLRAEAGARLEAARALLDDVEQAQRAGETAHRDALAKIARASVREPRHALSDLAAGLRAVDALVEQRSWREARDALAAWTAEAAAELDRAHAIAQANRAPIDRRNELRGLLKAYQAKARRTGALETPEVAILFEDAEGALYTAPADLDVAADLMTRAAEALR